MKKALRISMWVFVALLFGATLVYLFASSRQKAPAYEIISPTVANVERASVLTGSIEPRDEIEIKPQISGIIAEILVEPGDHVTNGQVIAKIKVIPEATQLSSAENRIHVARISLEEARLTYERTKELYDRKYESREKFEADRAAYERARQELDQAEDQLRIVKEGVSAFDAQGSNTLIRSTVTGLVLDVPVKVGSSVIQSNTFNDGTTIAKVADMTDLLFKGKVDETEADLIKEGMKVRISVGAMRGVDFSAVIEKIAPMATTSGGTSTFEVKAALAPEDTKGMRAGYSANATVVLESADSVLTLPESVVEFADGQHYVYVLKEGSEPQEFKKVKVETGISDDLKVEIRKGAGITKDSKIRGAEKTEQK